MDSEDVTLDFVRAEMVVRFEYCLALAAQPMKNLLLVANSVPFL